jgi:hypothetical protein
LQRQWCWIIGGGGSLYFYKKMKKEQYFIFEKSYDIELLNELGLEERFYFPIGKKT